MNTYWSKFLWLRSFGSFLMCAAFRGRAAGPWGVVLPQSFFPRPRSTLALGWPILAATILGAATAEPKRVLVVHSYVSAAPPFTTHSTAFETALTEEMGERVGLDEVSLDVARCGPSTCRKRCWTEIEQVR